MDPPADLDGAELARLLRETIGGRAVDNGGPRAPLRMSPNTAKRWTPRRSSQSGQARGGRAAATSASDGGGGITFSFTFSSRHVFVLAILVGAVALLLLVDAKTESALEEGAEAGTAVEVHHNLTELRSGENAKLLEQGGAANDAKGGSGAGKATMGFHDASPENIYGANRYYKPKGLGYATRPVGGLHPIYMADAGAGGKPNEGDFAFDDEYELSPYADKRLKMTDEERTTEQEEWAKKLQHIREKYGYWDFEDDYREKNKKDRPAVNWATVGEKKADYDPLLGEIDKDDFPKGAWQTDDKYVAKFVVEGKKLVQRMLDAIYDEYGMEDETKKAALGLEGSGGKMLGGKFVVAWMHESSFDALAKKLLNAMITNNHFYVTLGGHSAAAGHGNNFGQSYMMEFQRLMEPVFDRLGMVLVSANRAQGGMGTLQSALAGNGIYGDNDVVLWDSSMTEKDGRLQDIFWRMALLSGRRVPVLFDLGGGKAALEAIHEESGAHVGGVMSNTQYPKYKNTEFDFTLAEHKYNAVCWTDRVDVEPADQNAGYGGQASWHPGNFVHQWTARKISIVMLHALDKALDLWEKAASADGNPLDGKHWHLQAEEEKIRAKLQKVNATDTKCGELFPSIARFCTVAMKGAGEWAPRHDPDHSSIRSIAKPAPNGYTPAHLNDGEQLYPGRDPHVPSQRVPKGEVDVATIARSLPPRSKKKRRRLLAEERRQSAIAHSPVGDQYAVGRERRVEESKITPGQGWASENHPAGFCDGTSNAICYREKTNHCVLSGHNDARGVMKGDALSGWLVLNFKDMKEGIVMARMEPWHKHNSNARTEGWTAVNNGEDEGRRMLKGGQPLHESFTFEVAVNGVTQYKHNTTQFNDHCVNPGYNLVICVLWDDALALKNEKQDVEFAMRITGDGGRAALLGMTQIYWA
ncbi:hypothetical protein ACHAXT_010559 [Thalassiosira profunda]